MERHPCLSNVLKEALRIVEREQQEHRKQADRIEKELGEGSRLRPQEKLRRNVHKWRARGLLENTDGGKMRENEGKWQSWADIRGTPEP
jgi:hypothetical protein